MLVGRGETQTEIFDRKQLEKARARRLTPSPVLSAAVNYLLLKILKEGKTAFDVFETCIKNGLMIRDCSSFQCLDGEFVRFCIMMPEDNSRLLKVLEKV